MVALVSSRYACVIALHPRHERHANLQCVSPNSSIFTSLKPPPLSCPLCSSQSSNFCSLFSAHGRPTVAPLLRLAAKGVKGEENIAGQEGEARAFKPVPTAMGYGLRAEDKDASNRKLQRGWAEAEGGQGAHGGGNSSVSQSKLPRPDWSRWRSARRKASLQK